ncbi:MAG TPA: efflux RND transporter periplasmic adaptor subunit [Hyphomicrobium sp.]|nr:efflux RND transporter periplasmic adaptor subunit [Hyphomicrobium sp.]
MRATFGVLIGLTAAVMTAAVSVRADDANTQSIEEAVPVRGIIRALDQAALSTELQARASKIAFREGEAFKQGDLLISFDCERYRAESQSSEAVAREMRLTLESNEQLQKYSAVGKHDVEISRARVEKAEAEARSLKGRLQYCDVFAPYDGRVAELTINQFEQPQPNKPFLVIVGNNRLEVEIIVPSHWLIWIKPGAPLQFQVDETQRSYDAKVVRIGATVDAVSQMVKVIANFDAAPSDVLPGMSGAAQFVRPNG